MSVSTHILAGALGIMCWDILNNLNNDYQLLFKYRVGLPTVAYFVSRLGTLAYLLTGLILQVEVTPIGGCKGLQRAVAWTYVVCTSATSLLFFFRVRAVFSSRKYVIWFFSFMWLAVVGAALTAPQSVVSMGVSPTGRCISKTVKSFAVVCIIVPLVDDTLVLLAVTVGLVMNTQVEPTLKQGIRTVMYGDYLPAFSRAMLRDNQMYYLATVGCNLLTLVMFCTQSLPIVYRTMFLLPNTMLMNVMACRVFRNTKFCNQWMNPTTAIPSIAFHESDPISSASHAPSLISETDHQSRGEVGSSVAGRKLEHGDVIEIYSSHKIISIQEDRNRSEA